MAKSNDEIIRKLVRGESLEDCDEETKKCIGQVIKSQLSITAKDAQIILTLQRLVEGCKADVPHITVAMPSGKIASFIIQICVIDLDSKRPHKTAERILAREDIIIQFLNATKL